MLYLLYIKEKIMIAIRLPKEIEIRLNTLAMSTGRTKSYYVREALCEYLTSMENIYMAEKDLQNIRSRNLRTSSLKTVKKRRNSK